MATASGHGAAIMTHNDIMTRPAASPLRRVLRAPFTRRAWAEVWYTVVSVPLAFAGFVFTAATMVHPMVVAASAPVVRKFGDASRRLARDLLGEDVPAPPRPRPEPHVHGAVARDKATWRARGYFALKLPLAVASLVVVAGTWAKGLIYLTGPAWWTLPFHDDLYSQSHIGSFAASFALIPVGAALLLAAPWATHAVTAADRSLIRRLLGPASLSERVRTLEETRAHAVDDSAARLRGIERDLHDGTQAQLVALAMKLGLAKDKLSAATPADLERVTRLVDDAHRGAIEAIADLRTLARGIHPPVLDTGLVDALTTLAARSALPVELVTDIPERPSAAIETIAYFSAAELLTNAAKHSGARHVTLEAVHVPGLLRVRVSDDGSGGAHPIPQGGLRGLAERVRTVDGRLDVSSPRGGPTVVTVELPSHA
jgi:signal transduction histidine kinase